MSILKDQVALVTGASRGIGQQIATALAAEGVTVIGTATSPAGAKTVADFLADSGRGIVLDVTDEDGVQQAVKDINETTGAPTILVNNAGVTRDNLLLRMKTTDWDTIIDTNLSAIYRTSKACLRGMMKARHGRIINIGSVVGIMGNAGQANYAAAKAGMIGFTRALAREVGSRNITVNTIAPGFIETDMTRAMSETQRAEMAAQIPLGRLGQPEDIARAVVFLASGAGGYITGETLNINGGMYMA
ncbi:MAG: 3-oxoacyl-ACP reductase FabG [Gammaproteobacteria bacterium]|nr:3-oxoacyl-ACP reductase FabG [Gammaproteobacteria bacterium]MDH3769356.1 3-oxoacyl-ACP reductase FabG [Gammaproteobacteria bacterium]